MNVKNIVNNAIKFVLTIGNKKSNKSFFANRPALAPKPGEGKNQVNDPALFSLFQQIEQEMAKKQ